MSVLVDGSPTDIVFTPYADVIFILLTQKQKIGSLVTILALFLCQIVGEDVTVCMYVRMYVWIDG